MVKQPSSFISTLYPREGSKRLHNSTQKTEAEFWSEMSASQPTARRLDKPQNTAKINFKPPRKFKPSYIIQWRTGGLGGSNPSKIPKAFQNPVELNPIVKAVKNCWIYDANTPRRSEKRQ